ncbi:MAG: hypothetical protein HC942_11255, partial [Microcoleus sp. SU_5_6]|nr:hypothetical protein [Microcoleus sp. SU_5_6]
MGLTNDLKLLYLRSIGLAVRTSVLEYVSNTGARIMSQSKLPAAGASQALHFPQLFPRLPILGSDRAIWSGISLEYHLQPPFETPEYALDLYSIGINIGQSLRWNERWTDGGKPSKYFQVRWVFVRS